MPIVVVKREIVIPLLDLYINIIAMQQAIIIEYY